MASNTNMKLLTFYIVAVLSASTWWTADGGLIGMNWGRHSAQRLVPSMVVDLLLQNNITSARIYGSQADVLLAFAGSGIRLTISIFSLTPLTSLEACKKYVQDKTQYFTTSNIRNIYMGNHVFQYGMANKPLLHLALNAMENLQQALDEAGYGDQIKATLPHPMTILKNVTRPSEAEFTDEIKEEMIRFINIINRTHAPFVIELFPISYVYERNWDPEFGFLDNKSNFTITDVNGAIYNNIFTFMYDSYVWALRKIGATNITIFVSQVGWPTDGYPGANVTTAERFYRSLLPFIKSDKGTPARPGKPIDIHVHALADEHKLPYFYAYARHWGIYTSYGQPKYKIDLSGQGRDIYPNRIKGIVKMPQRWCVFNGNMSNINKVRKYFGETCVKADCTSLAPGGSCSGLTYAQNVSFAFNMYFQSQFQDEKACDFGGLGQVSMENPSIEGCTFPVEVVRGEQNILGAPRSEGDRLHRYLNFWFIFWLFWALI